KFIGFGFTLTCLSRRRLANIPKHSADVDYIVMFLPGRVGKHFEHYFSQRIIFGSSDMIQQANEAKARCVSAHPRQLVFSSAMRIVQLEYEFITVGNAWGKIRVSLVDTGNMCVATYGLS